MGTFDFLEQDELGAGGATEKEPMPPGSEYQALIERYIAYEVAEKNHRYDLKLGHSEAGRAILAQGAEISVAMLMHCVPEYFGVQGKTGKARVDFYKLDEADKAREINIRKRQACYEVIVRTLLRRKLPLNHSHLNRLLDGVLESERPSPHNMPLISVIAAVEHYASDMDLDDDLITKLEQLRQRVDKLHPDQTIRKLFGRIQSLIGDRHTLPLQPGDAWSDAAIADFEALQDKRDTLSALLYLCGRANHSKPSKNWLAEAGPLIHELGYQRLSALLVRWLGLVDKPRTLPVQRRFAGQSDPNLMLGEHNVDILKGLIWCAAFKENAELARALVKAALSCFRKVPGGGPRAVRVGNACIYTLAAMPGRSGLYQLAVLKVKIKYRSALNIINKALEEAAAREGISVDELEEMGVPAYGLDSVGYGEEPLGDYTAIISLPSLRQVELSWRNDDGKVQKSVPTRVKEDHAAELKELRGALKDIKAMLGVQRERLEQLFLKERVWPFEVWGERYRDHPLVGVLARNLIWRFSSEQAAVLGIYQDGQLLDSAGEPLMLPAGEIEVSLWHPITSDAVEVQAWRDCIERLQVVQPFKQAHREVYLLTDAEINTGVYSNRFASHIIKQHQFNALAATHGWRYTLQGAWDGGDDIARLGLPRFNLWAEFWVQGIGEYGNDTTEAGVFLYVSTDQVRFYRIRTGADDLNEENIDRDTSVDLREVPALVLSEVFRDVDLFVGVCSVGNDPQWSDGGPDGRYHDYWHSFSFGELNASAETRKAILQNLIPKLKIGPQCTFVGRFLVVEGQRRTYKIHLGSGNILMEPNNQYLCIVPDSRKNSVADKVFLPFEGDNTLSIILSKAVLLAEDNRIKDSTINSQIDHYR